MSELTESTAQLAIMRDRWRRGFCLPGYEPVGWWECDVFEVTAAGYFREYEVKLTHGDFRKDRLKAKTDWVYDAERRNFGSRTSETKHKLLARGDRRGPTRFWYVTRPALVDPAELPPWAGLIELDDRGERWSAPWRWLPRVVRPAPKLHSEKLPEATVRRAQSVVYYRMHNLLSDYYALVGARRTEREQLLNAGRFDAEEAT